ncbi:MAG: hypothetical protein HC886_11705 [Leptolyngbyaceae cyanobacterium SM1_1_3]|nr:hypothetical protein [Leptolyngbyaceae cyanobacterium SM1_1_3]NJM85043.1 hypothetical protein [Leptolyngbyaceae cyanobacterium RM2_2_21]NJN03956.1 hypothetical protein [Leptolyngbyaceae cyanobacterium RM1_1_2]NJO09427.1 hypothetical protein [Leptolyngbyaceae cyanobacterium SL_1_1]
MVLKACLQIYHRGNPVTTCPVRFRQDWLIAENAASYFVGEETKWTSLTEVRLKDASRQSAGNIDVERSTSEIAWSLYTLKLEENNFELVLDSIVYTEYWAAINQILTPKAGRLEDFIQVPQQKLDDKLDNPPNTQTILDVPLQ